MDSINSRIRRIMIELCDDSNKKFALRLNKKPNTVNNWIRDGDRVGRGVLSEILDAFPTVNPEWLIHGCGDMIRPAAENLGSGYATIPMFDIDAIIDGGNGLSSWPGDHPDYIDIGWLLKDSELALRIYGSSMSPGYPPGYIVGLKPHNDSFIDPESVYVIETRDGRYMKRLYMDSHANSYRCVSDNHSIYESGPMTGEYRYPDFSISLPEVVRFYRVVGVIKRNTL